MQEMRKWVTSSRLFHGSKQKNSKNGVGDSLIIDQWPVVICSLKEVLTATHDVSNIVMIGEDIRIFLLQLFKKNIGLETMRATHGVEIFNRITGSFFAGTSASRR